MTYPLKRPLFILLLAYMMGLATGFSGITFQWLVCLSLLFLLLGYVFKQNMAFFFCFFCVLLLGFSYGQVMENKRLAHDAYLEQEATVLARIEAAPKQKGIVLLKVQKWQDRKLEKPFKVALKRAYGDEKNYAIGATYAFKGTLLTPRLPRNPGDFDEAAYLKSQGIGYTFKSKKPGAFVAPPPLWQKRINALAQRLSYSLDQHLSSGESTLAKAILFGETGLLHKDFYSLAQKMGLAHLFAVSGLHVGFMVAFVLAIAQVSGQKRSPFVLLAVFILVLLYALVVNLQPSVIRAGVMALLALFLWQHHRYIDGLSLLTLAGWLVLLMRPYGIYAIGVQLSFVITFFLIIGMPVCQRLLAFIPFKPVREGLSASITAELGAFPLVAKHFSLWAPLGIIINLLVVPLFSLLMPILALAMFADLINHALAKLMFIPAGLLLDVLAWFLYFLDHIPIRWHWYLGLVPWPWVVLFMGLLIGFIYAYRQHWQKPQLLMLAFAIALTGIFFYHPPDDDLRLQVMDVGQGSGALLQTANGQWLLFDTGPYEDGVAQNLRALGINRLAAVVISHQDLDHINGLRHVLRDFSTDYVLAAHPPEDTRIWHEAAHMAELRKTKILRIENKHVLYLPEGSLSFQVIGKQDAANDHQLVGYYEDKKNNLKILFPGDANGGALNELQRQGPIDILLVPHHGSKHSLNENFYEGFAPKCAVISAGVDNRFDHPNEEVIDFLNKEQIPYYGTYETGALSFRQKEGTLTIETFF